MLPNYIKDFLDFHWPDTPDELRQVTLKEIHWLCDGLSLNPRGAFEEHHPKIIL